MSTPLTINSVETLQEALPIIRASQEAYSTFTQEQVDAICEKTAMAVSKMRIPLAKMACEETGYGIVVDKVTKNQYASEHVWNYMRNKKTCGVISEDKAYGVKKVASPKGVIAAITPTTNPTSTAIFKTLICLKTRNAIIISPHPAAAKCTIAAAKLVLDAAVKAGAPEGIIGWVDVPSIELTNMVMRDVDIILATGGPGMVKAAYSSGKPALGVGAGNTPVVIDDTADVLLAVNSIIHSKTFDNGMICASEQSVTVIDSIYDQVKAEFQKRGCYFVKQGAEMEALRAAMFKNGALDHRIPGMAAAKIAQVIVKGVFNLVMFVSGCRKEIVGLERIPRDTPVMYAANHRSFYDIVLAYATVPNQTAFISKKEIKKMPCVAQWMFFLNCQFMDRDDIKQSLQVILNAIALVKEGYSIYIAPEGTRNATDTLLEFKEGSMKIATKGNCPIVPVCFHGTEDIFENRLPWIHKGKIRVEFGEPIYPADLDKDQKKHLGELVRERVAALYENGKKAVN